MVTIPLLLLTVLYGGGVIAQFISGYMTWQNGGGTPGDGTSPPLPSMGLLECIRSAFTFPYGVAGILICLILYAVLIFLVMRMGYGDGGAYDKERNFNYSDKGTYGTSGFMTEREVKEVLDLTTDLRKHSWIYVLQAVCCVCLPHPVRLPYTASGTDRSECPSAWHG